MKVRKITAYVLAALMFFSMFTGINVDKAFADDSVITIAQARAAADGVTVTTEGKVSAVIDGSAWIQDGNAGIRLYNGNITSVQPGQDIQVTGKVSSYKNDKEITVSNFTYLQTNKFPAVTPIEVTLDQISQHQGQLIKVKNAWITGDYNSGSGGVYITTDGTNSAIVYAQAGASLKTYLQGLTKGQNSKYDIVAISSCFNDKLELLPIDESSITPSQPSQQNSKTFDFIEVTDFHGNLQADAKLSDGTAIKQQRGAVLAKQIKDIKTANPNTVILSGGDMFQGTPLSNVLYGQPVIDMLKSIGFDAMALGNHEYDWGLDKVIDTQNATLKNSSIPVLAANVYDKTTGSPVSYTKPYVMIEKDGVKIGIIGIVDNKEFPNIILPAFVKDVDFKDPAPIVNNLALKLRQQGAQIVVVLAHMGAFTNNGTTTGNLVDFANQVHGVDAIFGGHTHSKVTTKINNIPVGIAMSSGYGFIDLKITLNPDGTVTTGDMTWNDDYNLYNTANPVVDPDVQAIVDKANQEVGQKFSEVIGTADVDLTRNQSSSPYGDSALGNWTSEVVKDAVYADFGFGNNGGLRIDVPKGDITLGTMYTLMPFDNTIVTLSMTGSQIKTVLEQAVQDGGKGIQVAGLKFKYDPSKPSMQRVFDMKKSDGTPIDMNTKYLVATNNFMGTGGDKFDEFKDPAVASSYVDTQKLVRDAFVEAIKAAHHITASTDGRIAPATMPVSNGTTVTVLATSDLHGNLVPWDYSSAKSANQGLAKVATYVNQVRSQNPNVVLVDNGDTIQGTPLSYYYDKIDTTTEYPMAKAMGAMKYDTWTLGNHEYNYGFDVLNRVIKDMQKENIHVLSANTYKDDGTNFVEPYYIKTITTPQGDVKVGILGLTTKTIPSWEDKAHYAGLNFNDLVEEANKWVPKVRAAGADIVVVAMHSGEESASDTIPENQVKAVATGVNGIDAIIAGHTHAVIQQDTYKNPAGQNVIVTEPGKWGQYVSQIDFNISKDSNGKWVIDNKTSKAVKMDDSIQADPTIMQLAESYQDATLKYIGTKIGVASGDFLGTDQLTKETALMDLINKVQKYYAKTDLSIAAPLSSSAQILKGDVTIQDMMRVYVYENYLYGIKMTGKQLKDWMEWSVRYYQQVKSPQDPITKDKTLNIPDYNLDQLYGASYTIDLTQPAGSRIKNLSVNGKPVKDSDVFTVAINNYRFNGGGGFMKAAGITNPEVVFDSAKAYGDDGQVRNLMTKYIQEKGTIDPTVDNYWTISETPVSTSGLSTVMTGPTSVNKDSDFTVSVALAGVSQAVYAQDFTMNYDANMFDFNGLDNVNENVAQYVYAKPGSIRIFLVSKGGGNAITKDSHLFDLKFRAKWTAGNSDISISKAVMADDGKNEFEALASKVTVNVSMGYDLNNDGEISFGDLGVIAKYYGLTKDSAKWNEAQIADLNNDGTIGLEDLVILARQIHNQNVSVNQMLADFKKIA
ncbi:5'-nucleotidase C-terminal domain-containing protein [Thermoanaerobacterium sp. RBIITD]|uniref:5'-nucleotidase C-terminal domain-containing protein n=1 Tax=Thermoanaerobacterium sp. RBIITD TaxID=1550240 RepID=UPI000BC030B6|nr:5'-nucleotidase C-terminal domain-containing protein [Thermoanaerobacterium sp. RBIITD]SNX53513.1 2',3'-cyclic-nucleotide 2'-phosphodiesterase / 3'-nucleotidase [Thermoanaerobacterium sp. RBIITD]